MRYLVTGVTGQLGYDVVRVLKENGITNIYAPTSSEFDITNKEIVVSKTKEFNPDVIIHCAAYTKVDQAEIDTDTCYKVNVDGTKNMTEAAKENPKCGKNIGAVCKGKRRQAGGFIWKYA